MTDSAIPTKPAADRFTRWIVIAIGVYSALLVSFLNLVVLCHSVVLFFFMFIVWAWMLSRWDFTPLKVLLLFGFTGSLAEATINPTSLIGGFWVFVYGLMVYLPACTVPPDRGAKPLRWRHYPMAVFLPFLGVIPGGLVATVLRKVLDVHFLPGVE